MNTVNGAFVLTYEFFNIRDRIIITKAGFILFDTGCVSTDPDIPISQIVSYTENSQNSNFINIIVFGGCV